MPVTGKTTHKVDIAPTQADYARYVGSVTRRVTGGIRWHYLVSIAISIILARLLGDYLAAHKWMFDTPEMYICIYLVLNILILRLLTPRFTENYVAENQHWTTPKTIELKKSGFRVKSKHTQTDIEWACVSEIIDMAGMIVFFIDRTMGFVIPRYSFENEQEADEYLAAARSYCEAAQKGEE